MKSKKRYAPYMLRPIIYLAAYRAMVAAIFLLLIVRLVPKGPAPAMVAGFLTVLFALLTYLVYLRMDGLRVPRMKYIRPKKKADPMRSVGDMSDYTDEDPPVTFEELEDDEKDFCSFIAGAVNLVIWLALSFVL